MSTDQVVTLSDCSQISQLPSLWFMMNNNWYQADPQDYVISSGKTCQLCIQPTQRQQFIFGLAFLRNYYVVHNSQTYQFGLTPHIHSSKQLIVTDKSPTKGIYLGAAVTVESLLGLSATGSASYILYKYILNNDPYL